MVAGQSIKLEPGFKVCSGATFSASIDADDPTLKSLLIEKLNAPLIKGSKYVSNGGTYSTTESEYNNISWTLLGNNTSYNTDVSELCLPAELEYGQYTLTCKVKKNGQEAASSRIIVVGNAVATQLKHDLHRNDSYLMLYPNPTTGIVSVKLNGIEDEISCIVKNLEGKIIATYNDISVSNPAIDLSSLQKGIYLVDFASNGNIVARQKLIKQ